MKTTHAILLEAQAARRALALADTAAKNRALAAMADALTAAAPEILAANAADLQAALDPEESARITLEDGYTVILVDIPVKPAGQGEGVYTTVPLGILLTQDLIITVCSVETAVLGDFAACRVRGFSTRKKMRFVYQILYRAATLYQQELRLIDRRRQSIEKNLTGTLRDSDLMELHGLESSLVYFATSLRANLTVLDRLTRYKRLEQYPDNRELLDDVIVEIRQAIDDDLFDLTAGLLPDRRDRFR